MKNNLYVLMEASKLGLAEIKSALDDSPLGPDDGRRFDVLSTLGEARKEKRDRKIVKVSVKEMT